MVRAALVLSRAACLWVLCILASNPCEANRQHVDTGSQCHLPDAQRYEIQGYKAFVQNLHEYVVNGTEKGVTYRRTAELADDFGPRFTGSRMLEQAINYTLERLLKASLDRVWTEDVKVPYWVRGEEFAYLLLPRKQRLAILGLGGSVATPEQGIVAEAIVVKSFEELRRHGKNVAGKIVVFDQDYTSYENSAYYRIYGAREAARLGAVAALVRSPTPFSLYTVHGGLLSYSLNATQIPGAAITVEDAEMLRRLYLRGQKIVIQLHMEAKTYPYTISRNIIAEIKGREKPDEVVIIGAHIDSWDVGQGALDDAGGATVAVRVLEILRHLAFKPRRTLRLVLWTGEEVGRVGRSAYVKQHRDEAQQVKLVLNTESGSIRPRGMILHAVNKSNSCILREVSKLFSFMGAGHFHERRSNGYHDSGDFHEQGIPVAAMENKDERYFYYHHSQGDTMNALNSHHLDLATAFWTALAYIASDLVALQ